MTIKYNITYDKTFEGGNIRDLRDYAANRECFPLEYFCVQKP